MLLLSHDELPIYENGNIEISSGSFNSYLSPLAWQTATPTELRSRLFPSPLYNFFLEDYLRGSVYRSFLSLHIDDAVLSRRFAQFNSTELLSLWPLTVQVQWCTTLSVGRSSRRPLLRWRSSDHCRSKPLEKVVPKDESPPLKNHWKDSFNLNSASVIEAMLSNLQFLFYRVHAVSGATMKKLTASRKFPGFTREKHPWEYLTCSCQYERLQSSRTLIRQINPLTPDFLQYPWSSHDRVSHSSNFWRGGKTDHTRGITNHFYWPSSRVFPSRRKKNLSVYSAPIPIEVVQNARNTSGRRTLDISQETKKYLVH